MLEIFKNIILDRGSALPLYQQLKERFKSLILDGTLPPDLKLPSVRQLCNTLAINQVTVVAAFKELEYEGYVLSRRGSGTYVADITASSQNYTSGLIDLTFDEAYSLDDTAIITENNVNVTCNTINFASATPTPDLFPVEDFKLVLNEVLERDKGNAFSYLESQGFYPLRESITQVLKLGGIHCLPQDIQIISGAQQGIDIISKALLRQNDAVITESPTYTGAVAVFLSRQSKVLDVEMNDGGPDLNVIEYHLKKNKPGLIYTIPSFQNPTGFSYSNQKRQELLYLANRYNIYVIEDDYVSDLDFEGRNYSSLKSLDKYGKVILIKSFSKMLMPGLRLGFMVVPEELREKTAKAKHSTDISTSSLIQRAFDLYLRKGMWSTHSLGMKKIFEERYRKTINSLDIHLPSCASWIKPGGGLNIWLELPCGFPSVTLERQAALADIVFAPGRLFYSSANVRRLDKIRISYASVYTPQIETGIMRLCQIIDQLHLRPQQSQLPIL